MLNFGQKVEEKSSDTIPKDTLLWAVINIREIKNSRETNGRYLDIELTIADNQPYARRKIWEMIADPFDANNSEEWRAMGYGAIRRILEAVKGASPDNANSYTLNQLTDIHGLMVPIITKVEKGKDGYDDKNKAEFLSPHSSVKKIVECFRLLQTGVFEYGKKEKPPTPGQGSMFTGTGTPPPVAAPHAGGTPAQTATAAPAGNAPGWLAPAGSAPAAQPPAQPAPAQVAPQAGFQTGQVPPTQAPTPAGHAAPHAQPSGTMPTHQPAPAAAPAPSPSNGGWQPPGTGTPAAFPGGNQ